VTFIDDHSKKVWVYFLRQKSEVYEVFKKWKAMVENKTGLKVKKLRSDNGGEYEDRGVQKVLLQKWHQARKDFAKDTATEWCGRTYEPNID
jgi:hypothetical protein